jgi:hypothetical protein
MIYVSLISFILGLAGLALLVGWLASNTRHSTSQRTSFNFLKLRSTAVAGWILAILGGAGVYITSREGHGFITLFTAQMEGPMTLTGTIDITQNWAQLNLDPGQFANGQQVQGFVILEKDPIAPGATDPQRIDAGRQYFEQQKSLHYKVTGQFQTSGGLQYLLVQNAMQIPDWEPR